ncbi:enolase C-terminal domain-like protein [Actinopolymorpha pittospori]
MSGIGTDGNSRASSFDRRIDGLDVAAYTVPTDAPEGDGTLMWTSTTLVLVRVRAGGATGVGWTYGSTGCVAVIADDLAGVVTGRDALDVAAAFDAMVKSARNSCRPGLVGYAISAVDVALWDLKARLLGLPLYKLLGSVREDVPVYGSGGFTTYDDERLRDQLELWTRGQRIPRVKIKIAESWGSREGRDLARMRLCRETIDQDTELYVDANGGYTAKQAIRVMAAAQDLDVRWLEEPASSDDLAGLREVRREVRADVAAGEYGHDLVYFRRMCEAQAVDCLQADASRCGGITEWLRVAAVAAAYGLEISAHCAPNLHLHAAAATSNLRHLEWFHDHVRIEEMFFDGTLDPTGGALRPDPTRPDHGLCVRDADIEPYRVQ